MPIQAANEPRRWMSSICDGDLGGHVAFNKARANVHGCNVFVVKVQLTTADVRQDARMLQQATNPESCRGLNKCVGDIMIYDQLRTVLLLVLEDETTE